MTYTYNGNKLKKVDDVAEHSVGNDFIDGADEEIEYFYDENGNLISDQNKSINVEYNYMNLPELITFSDGKRIQWIYDANGNKLRKNVYDEEGICTSYKDYANGFVYSDGSLDFFSHAEGRVKALTNGLFEYHYDYKDHLGNIRVTYKADSNNEAKIIQEDHYYPFGVRLAHMSMDDGSNNKYLYNSKELIDDHNLYVYHYGARNYDPQLGHWWQVDPADEFYSPYVYCHNDPVNFLDRDGRIEDDVKSYYKRAYNNNECENINDDPGSMHGLAVLFHLVKAKNQDVFVAEEMLNNMDEYSEEDWKKYNSETKKNVKQSGEIFKEGAKLTLMEGEIVLSAGMKTISPSSNSKAGIIQRGIEITKKIYQFFFQPKMDIKENSNEKIKE